MKSPLLAGLLLVTLASASACGDDDDASGGPSADELCARYDAVGVELSCTPGDCQTEASNARTIVERAGCESQYNAVNACALSAPSSSFECATSGGVNLKEDACLSQQEALAECVLGS